MTKKRATMMRMGLLAVVVLGALLYVLVSHYAADGSAASGVTPAVTTSLAPQAGSGDLISGEVTSESTESAGTGTQGTSSVSSTQGGTTFSSTSVDEDSEGYTETGSSYVSDSVSVSISTVSTGSGDDTITYYVADVLVASGTGLQAGLADEGRGTADTSDIAAACDAVFAVNGDYFGARDDGIIIRNGEILRDDGVRTGLALYTDGHMEILDETGTSAQELLDQGVWNTYSFGPALLIDGEMPEDVGTYEVEKNPKHPIQGRDPRTGIGIIDDNHFIFIVVDGRDSGYSKGVTLEEFAQIFKDLGCTTAYNLDGGGSSTMWFMGELVNSPSNKSGERDISDILFVG